MNEIDFPTTGEYSKEDIKCVQNTLLKMAKEVDRILTTHGIHYLITFGTLLGAVRHQGFIPWDDDFDIFLFDNEYELALQYLRNELPAWIIVHDKKTDPIYWPSWSRLRDRYSETLATKNKDDNHYKYRGINLDLYRLKKMPRKKVSKYILGENINHYMRKYQRGFLPIKTLISKYSLLIPKYLVSSTKACFSNSNTEVFSFMISFHELSESVVFPLKKYPFQGMEFWGPNDFHIMLKIGYGDYMKLPEYKNRKPHYSWVKFMDNTG